MKTDAGSEEELQAVLRLAVDEEQVSNWAEGALSALWSALTRREACLALCGNQAFRYLGGSGRIDAAATTRIVALSDVSERGSFRYLICGFMDYATYYADRCCRL